MPLSRSLVCAELRLEAICAVSNVSRGLKRLDSVAAPFPPEIALFLRPCFLVVDNEFAGSISTRKLVIETAKFNVISAFSYAEAIATLQRFPNVHATVVTADRAGYADAFLKHVRSTYPEIKRVVTGEASDSDGLADRRVESFAPEKLLQALRELFPQPSVMLIENEIKLEEAVGEQ